MRRLFTLAAVAVVVAFILLGIHFYRYRHVRHNTDLVRLLPPGDLNIFYVNLDVLRRAQLIGLLANIKVAPDNEYSDFIRQTAFDYTRDLDAIAIGSDASQTLIVGRGRFDWKKLQHFSDSHHGTCVDGGCRMPATSPGEWVNLITIQPDVLAVSISPNPLGADNLRPPGRRIQEEIPDASAYARISRALLTNPTALPLPLRIFVIDLQSAATATLCARIDHLALKATFQNAAAAATAKQQLEMQTRLLTAATKQSEGKADDASLAGMLTSGNFQVMGNDLNGDWPIRPELLRALQ